MNNRYAGVRVGIEVAGAGASLRDESVAFRLDHVDHGVAVEHVRHAGYREAVIGCEQNLAFRWEKTEGPTTKSIPFRPLSPEHP